MTHLTLHHGLDSVDEARLVARAAQQLDAHANRHQRIAQLVGEHRDELVLTTIGIAQLLRAQAQRTLGALLLRDIAYDRHGTDDVSLWVADGRRAHLAMPQLAGTRNAHELLFAANDLARQGAQGGCFFHRPRSPIRAQHLETRHDLGHSHTFHRRMAEFAQRRRIGVRVVPLHVGEVNLLVHTVEQRAEPFGAVLAGFEQRAGLLQIAVQRLELRAVLMELDEQRDLGAENLRRDRRRDTIDGADLAELRRLELRDVPGDDDDRRVRGARILTNQSRRREPARRRNAGLEQDDREGLAL